MSRKLRIIDVYDELAYVPGSLTGRAGRGHAWAYTCRHCGRRLEQDDSGSGSVAIFEHIERHQEESTP